MPRKIRPCIDCGKPVRSKTSRCVQCAAFFRFRRKGIREQRFWDKVNKDGPTMPHMTTPCWEWIGSRNKQGYGQFGAGGAHRYSFLLHFGELPTDKDICHTCDNPPCIRPDHLFSGTTQDNILDMERKGRAYHPGGLNHGTYTKPESRTYGQRNGMYTKPESIVRGTKHPNSKLTEEQVVEIRNLHEQGMGYRKLAKLYEVGQTTIGHIIKRDNWKHI